MARKTTPTAKGLAATYSRVSDPNDRKEASLETQEAAQVALLESRGYVVPPEYRFREKFTGMESIYDRPVLGRLRDLIEAGTIRAMASYDTDRLARDSRHLITVVAENEKCGAETLFVKCDHAAKGRIGELILYMKGFASALEWDAILDRTTRGRQRILDRGQFVGGGVVKYGYVWCKEERRRTANPETAGHVRRIFAAVADGMSLQALAAALDREGIPTPYAYAGRAGADSAWWPTCLRRLIRDRTYLGIATSGKDEPSPRGGRTAGGRARRRPRPESERTVLADGRTEALVDRETFDRANRAMAAGNTRRGKPAVEERHLLSGVVYCGACGARMTPTSFLDRRPGATHKRRRSYRCFSYRLKDAPRCNRVCGADKLEAAAWAEIRVKVLEPGWLEREAARVAADDGADRYRADLAAAEARRARIGEDVRRLLDAQLANTSRLMGEALEDKLRTLDAQAEDLDRHVEDLRGRIAAAGGRGRLIEGFMAAVGRVRDLAREGRLDAAQRRMIVDLLGARVIAPATPGDRVRVELPFDTRSATRAHSSCRMSPSGTTRDGVIVLESQAEASMAAV